VLTAVILKCGGSFVEKHYFLNVFAAWVNSTNIEMWRQFALKTVKLKCVGILC